MKSKTDFLLGGFSNNQYLDKYFSSSLVYYDDDLTWCVNRVESISFSTKLRHVAMKLALILSLLVVCVNSMAVLFVLRLVKDKYGYMKFDLNVFTQHAACSTSTRIPKNENVGIFGRASTSRNVLIIMISMVIGMMSVAWNFMILKAIVQPIPGYQIQTVDELISHNFRLSGGVLSNVSVWENSQVN